MSISPVVDANYRLHPTDLDGAPRRVIIANVTYQGIEEMTPVLHFVGQTKRLVLSAEQVEQVIAITGTLLYSRWVGTPLILSPDTVGQATTISIQPVSGRRGQPMPVQLSEDRRGWILALTVVSILLLISATFAILNLETLLASLQLLRDNWPLR